MRASEVSRGVAAAMSTASALGLTVEWEAGQNEKNLTHADWTEALEMYKTSVMIIERLATPLPQPEVGDVRDAARYRWLRNDASNTDDVVAWHMPTAVFLTGEKLDDVIDTAMSASPPTQQGK